jgi:hypothetical protein
MLPPPPLLLPLPLLMPSHPAALLLAAAELCRKPFAQPRRHHNKEGACCFQMNKSYCSKVMKWGLLRTLN